MYILKLEFLWSPLLTFPWAALRTSDSDASRKASDFREFLFKNEEFPRTLMVSPASTLNPNCGQESLAPGQVRMGLSKMFMPTEPSPEKNLQAPFSLKAVLPLSTF